MMFRRHMQDIRQKKWIILNNLVEVKGPQGFEDLVVLTPWWRGLR